jgi:hypothetical protein
MMSSITAAQETATVATAAPEAKPGGKKASGGVKGRKAAPSKGKAARKPSSGKKAPKRPQKAGHSREGTKAGKVLELLKRPGGVTLDQLMKATGWQAHSVRGFLSGVVGKKMRLPVMSAKTEEGGRTYSVKA